MSDKLGRPLKFKTPEELRIAIESYFKDREEKGRIPTIAGLACFLGLDRQTIYNYEKKSDYFDIIKEAKDYIIAQLEDELINKQGGQVAGLIFIAKQYGYTDRQEIDHNVNNYDEAKKKIEQITGITEENKTN